MKIASATCTAAYDGSDMSGASPPKRTLACTEPGRSTSSSGPVSRSGEPRHRVLPLGGGPAAEVPLDEVEGAAGHHVTDQDEDAAVGGDPPAVRRPQGARRDVEDLLGPRDPPAVGMVAVAAGGPGIGRRRGWLGELQPAVLGQPAALALDAAARVGRAGQHLPEDVEESAEARAPATPPRA